MIIRQLKQEQYNRLHRALIQKAHAEPLEACYCVDLAIGSACYVVKIQPESRRRMAVLQAYRFFRDEYGQVFELITTGAVLAAFPELLIYQGVA